MTGTRTLTALRVEATVLMSLAIGQAGLAAGFLGGQEALKPVHGVNALLLVVVTITLLVTAVVHRHASGLRWPALAATILLAIEIVQLLLARADVVGLHIFCGVLYVVLTTLLTSYLFRPGFVPPESGRPVRG